MDSLNTQLEPQLFSNSDSVIDWNTISGSNPLSGVGVKSNSAFTIPDIGQIESFPWQNFAPFEQNEGIQVGSEFTPILNSNVTTIANTGTNNLVGEVQPDSGDTLTNFSDRGGQIQRSFSKSTTPLTTKHNAGVYTVDSNGKVIVDFLADGGAYQSQMALFSLQGMENLVPGSPEFIQAAARRALSSTEGYVVIQDDREAARFNLGSDRYNDGTYTGRKVYNFQAGDKIAMMLVPNGSVAELLNNPHLEGDKRPLFSIASANPKGAQQLADIGYNVFGWEDRRQDRRGSDVDFNDLLFQIKGISGNTPQLGEIKKSREHWQKGADYREMMNYAKQYLAPDRTAPELTIGLARDTGSNRTDGITNNPTIAGRVRDKGDIIELSARFQGSNTSHDVVGAVGRNGKFNLDRSALESIYGGKLNDGSYTLNLTAQDDRGNQSTQTLNFTLDTTISQPTFDLVTGFDSGIVGDRRTNFAEVHLTGKTDAFANLVIQANAPNHESSVVFRTTADANGNYSISGVDLAFGLNNFIIRATDAAGNTTTNEQQIRRIANDDAVITWNKILLNAIATDKTAPPLAARNMAMVGAAVYDAVNNIDRQFKSYLVDTNAPLGASAEAAAVQAAYRVLLELYPQQKATFDAALVDSLAQIADGKAEDDGVAFGQQVAEQIIAARANDGVTISVNYIPGLEPGQWQPTPDGGSKPALLPQWRQVTPFVTSMNSGEFLAPPPPALTSAEYAAEFNQTKEFGAANSTIRTAEQTEIAKFWADGAGTYTPPGHWNQISQDVALDRGNSLVENARLFAMVNISVADAGICCWDAKYTYNFWRPITAIRNGDIDGNAATTADPDWSPLLTTPPFPEYTSGHSTFSGAGSSVLTALYGDNYQFSTTSMGLPGVSRQFTSFSQAANEGGMSRIYGGIHFMSANTNGLEIGRKLGNYVATNLFTPLK
jgi:hypothetical protein